MSVNCGVCDTHMARYKCPSCQLQYCSIECYKRHQIIHAGLLSLVATQLVPNGLPPKPPAAVAFTGAPNSHVHGGGPSFETCSPSSLESSANLQILYTRYPQLQDQLKEIYEAATEPRDDQLNDQSFSNDRGDRGAGRGRNRRRGRDGRTAETWSRQKGIKSGINRLRILRHLKGEDGDGLREFSKLVTSHFEAKRSTTRLPAA